MLRQLVYSINSRLESIFKKYDLKNEIFYAHKSNKSKVFLKEALKNNIWIDVSWKHWKTESR